MLGADSTKQHVPITSKSSSYKGETQHYVVKLPKSASAPDITVQKILRVPGTLRTHANSSPAKHKKVSERLHY